jgi:hypothetical protein
MTDESPGGPESPETRSPAEPTDVSLRAWRRLDWRFLLPQLPTGVLVYQLGVPQDLVAALALLRMDEVHAVSTADWPRIQDGTVQLVILSDPSGADLAEAVRVLAPSGCLYVEVRLPAAPTAARPWTLLGVRRLLRSAGLHQVHAFWHAPDHAESARIVPLDQPAAVRGTLMRYEGIPYGHLKSVLGRLALRVGLLPLATTHGSVIAHRGASESQEPSLSLVQRRLKTDVGQRILSRLGLEADSAVVLVTPRFPTSRHVIGLVEQKASGAARLVVKIPRRPYDNSGVSREATVLRDLVAREPSLQAAVPEVLALVDERHHLLLIETAMSGTVLGPGLVQANPDEAARAGLAFIQRLPVTREARVVGNDWFERTVGTPLTRFEQRLGHALRDGPGLVRRTREQLVGLASEQLPLVFEHGDLSHPNLFLHAQEGLRVIDWERSTPDGLVGLDLVFYLQYLAESRQSAYARHEQVAVLRENFLEPTGWGRRLLVDHLQSRGVDPALALEVLLASWARTACTLVDRLAPTGTEVGAEPLSLTDLAAVPEDRDVVLWLCALEYIERERGTDGASVG